MKDEKENSIYDKSNNRSKPHQYHAGRASLTQRTVKNDRAEVHEFFQSPLSHAVYDRAPLGNGTSPALFGHRPSLTQPTTLKKMEMPWMLRKQKLLSMKEITVKFVEGIDFKRFANADDLHMCKILGQHTSFLTKVRLKEINQMQLQHMYLPYLTGSSGVYQLLTKDIEIRMGTKVVKDMQEMQNSRIVLNLKEMLGITVLCISA